MEQDENVDVQSIIDGLMQLEYYVSMCEGQSSDSGKDHDNIPLDDMSPPSYEVVPVGHKRKRRTGPTNRKLSSEEKAERKRQRTLARNLRKEREVLLSEKSFKNENGERKPRKIGGKRKKEVGSLYWFVNQGAIKPAPKREPNAEDPSGYHYLRYLEKGQKQYTVILGRYKKDERFFVVGKETSDTYVLVHIGEHSVEVFSSPSAAPTHFIRLYQTTNGLQRNSSRMSGIEYLRFIEFCMPWMRNPEFDLTLKQASDIIQAEMVPPLPLVRNANDLSESQYPESMDEEIGSGWVNSLPRVTKQDVYLYTSYPAPEVVGQCHAYLQLPSQFKKEIDPKLLSLSIIKDEDISHDTVRMEAILPKRDESATVQQRDPEIPPLCDFQQEDVFEAEQDVPHFDNMSSEEILTIFGMGMGDEIVVH